jgi:hypothetical protein
VDLSNCRGRCYCSRVSWLVARGVGGGLLSLLRRSKYGRICKGLDVLGLCASCYSLCRS